LPGDVVDAATRSRMMAGIRSKDTVPELVVRRGLHALGFRYRLHDRSLPGTPDLVLPRWKAAIQIHGCFWHRHDCTLFRWPATRPEFWRSKIARNVGRDREVDAALDRAGWRVLTIWECAMKGPGRIGADAVITAAADWLRAGDRAGEIRGTNRASG
jgi:DNA mismatch endonuclease, patch repair protein